MPLRSIADSKDTNIQFTEFSHELQYSKSTVPVHRFGFLHIIENVHNWSTVQLRFNHCCRHSTVTRSTCSEASIKCPPTTPKIYLIIIAFHYYWPLSSIWNIAALLRPTTTWVPMTWLISPMIVTTRINGWRISWRPYSFGEDTWVRKFPVAQ